jgi:hypothetical protein
LRKEMRFLAGWGASGLASGFDSGALGWSVFRFIFFFYWQSPVG